MQTTDEIHSHIINQTPAEIKKHGTNIRTNTGNVIVNAEISQILIDFQLIYLDFTLQFVLK